MTATYSVEEAARLLGISRYTAYGQAKAGSLPTIRLGRRLLVPKSALDALLGIHPIEQHSPHDSFKLSEGEIRNLIQFHARIIAEDYLKEVDFALHADRIIELDRMLPILSKQK